MGIINVLDKHTANLIAAGEVVERPSSAIKELMENSADAGATQITVEIKNGGSSYIRVSDNGCGIAAEDVPTCILRHATSKIKTKDDLAAISTLGFRGEALAAISAVTRLRIMTKRASDETGTYFAADFGEKKEINETGCPVGTTIIAESLFENVPARRKFLRKDVSESKAVGAAVEKFALSKPYIAVTFISDGAVKLKTPGDGSLKNCIYASLGREFTDNMLPVSYEFDGLSVSGFIGKPQIARPNRNLQNFFINERYIKSGTMTAGLEEGFKSFCPIGKFPACVLFLTIDFDKVDINIHPAKLEVKFSGERQVFETIMYAVRNALSRGTENISLPRPQRDLGEFGTEPSQRSTTFSEALSKPSEMIADKGIISVPNPESIEKFFGKDSGKELNSRNFDYSLPDYAKAPENKVQTSEPEKAPAEITPEKVVNPIQSTEPEPIEFVRVDDETLRKFGCKIPEDNKSTQLVFDAPEVKEEADTEAETCEKTEEVSVTRESSPAEAQKELTPDDISLFRSMPGKAKTEPDIPFRESTDEDTAAELMSRVANSITVIGEAFNSYIIVQRDNTLYMIDKHAAHERIIYESLKKGKKEGGTQLLLMPLTVDLAAEESIALAENGDYLENIGYVFEEFGSNSYIIRGVPAEIDIESASETFVYLAGQIARGGGKAIGDIFDRALYTAACKAAVKAGTKTSKLSSTMIADILFSDEAVLYCPHGRPVLLEFTKSKLDKMFSRT
ncbi:MAG: DNA mismatch repair endonuclease MutL [Clostridia bacterium]|nr:DNA mismatch repair endonuclease MutL [Clostridia bacterium]